MTSNPEFTVPGITTEQGGRIAAILQDRLNAMNDLHLTLKHAHWNVVGRDFIGVHEMLDPQIELVRGYADDIAERIAALGASPIGVPGRLAWQRPWEDYAVDRASTMTHLKAIDQVYVGVITSHREAMAQTGEVDPVTEDMLTGQTGELEKFQWFVRAHFENADGTLGD